MVVGYFWQRQSSLLGLSLSQPSLLGGFLSCPFSWSSSSASVTVRLSAIGANFCRGVKQTSAVFCLHFYPSSLNLFCHDFGIGFVSHRLQQECVEPHAVAGQGSSALYVRQVFASPMACRQSHFYQTSRRHHRPIQWHRMVSSSRPQNREVGHYRRSLYRRCRNCRPVFVR